MPNETPNRCRLVLVAPSGATPDVLSAQFARAVEGGDIASLILPQYDLDEVSFQKQAQAVAPIAQQAGVALVLAGDSRVAGRVGADAFLIAGATTLGGLAALIDRMALFISNDTGPAHIACALGTPSVTIFGPADIRRWAPEQNELHAVVHKPVLCSPCGYSTCPIDHRCLRSIGVADVLQAAHRVLNREAETCVA